METQDTIIISLTILMVYFLYQQNNQTNSAFSTSENQEQITKLQQKVKHYQSLYQKRVEKDLEVDQSQKIKELTEINHQLEQKVESEKNNEKLELYQQKINEQDKALLNLARQKIKGKKDAEKILNELETNFKDKETGWEKEKEQQEKVFQEKLRKINVLFDEKAQDYSEIDFNGLYKLLEKIREEKEQSNKELSEQIKTLTENNDKLSKETKLSQDQTKLLEAQKNKLVELENQITPLNDKEMELTEFRASHNQLIPYFQKTELIQTWKYIDNIAQDYFKSIEKIEAEKEK